VSSAPERARVLLVDDNQVFANVVQRALRSKGYACGVVTSYQAALEAVESNTFDAVVTDLHIRGESGLALLAAIRASTPQTKRLLMSGSLGPSETVGDPTIDGYLQKPFDIEALIKLIDKT
jgi:CheY-like chemotaxis protein